MKRISTYRVLVFAALGFLSISHTAFGQTAIPTGTFTPTATCSATGQLTWDNSGISASERVLIFIKPGAAVATTAPTADYTSYTTASADYSSLGDAYEKDGLAHLVFKGHAGGPVNMTNLDAGVTYHFLILNTSGGTGTTYSAGLDVSGTTIAVANPLAGPTAVPGSGSVAISWTNTTNCADEIVLVTSTATIATVPTGDGTAYSANLTYGSGGAFGGAGEHVSYKGSTSPQPVSGLTNGTPYFFKIFTRKGKSWSTGLEITATPNAATSPVTSANLTVDCTDQLTLSWTNPGTVGTILVFAKFNAAINSTAPTGNIATTYPNPASTNFASPGDLYEKDASAFLIYKGIGTSVTLTGLGANKDYEFLIFNVIGTSTYSAGVAKNATTLTTPPPITGTPSTTATSGQMQISWTDPTACKDQVMVVVREDNPVSTTPSGTSYTPHTNFTGRNDLAPGLGEQVVFFAATGNNVTVTTLANCHDAYYAIYVLKGGVWSTAVTGHGTPSAAPVITTFLPMIGATSFATNGVVVLTFDQSISFSGTTATATDQEIFIKQNGATLYTINKNDPSIIIVGNIVTIDVNSLGGLALNMPIEVVIGPAVFKGCALDYAGTTGNYLFSTSKGIMLTKGSAGVCTGSYTVMSDIVLQETANNNFQPTGTSKTIVLKFQTAAGYAFQSNTGTVSYQSATDVTSTTTTAPVVTFSGATLTINFASAGTNSSLDKITISGLSITTDGTGAGTNHLLLDASSTLSMQGLSVGSNLADITASASAPIAPTAPAFTGGKNAFCQFADLSAIHATVTSPNTIKWYRDISLTKLVYTGNSPILSTDLKISKDTAKTSTFYVTQTSGCQSPSIVVNITINPAPGSDAGNFGATTQCSGTQIQLGGSPTAITPSTPPYKYRWSELTHTYLAAIDTFPNPKVVVNNNSGGTENLKFQVVITDKNGCKDSTVNTFNVFPATTPFLTNPTFTSFTKDTPGAQLTANIPATTFTGIGVIQTGSSSFKFDAAQAYDPNKPLPQYFQIRFNGTDLNSCAIDTFLISTFAIDNAAFAGLLPQYCSLEKPYGNKVGSGEWDAIPLIPTGPTVALTTANVNNWNTTYRKNYTTIDPNGNGNIPAWASADCPNYKVNDLVTSGSEIYRCLIAAPPSIFGPPALPAYWAAGAFEVVNNGTIRNQAESQNGGLKDPLKPSIVPTLLPQSYKYEMFTNPDYASATNLTTQVTMTPSIYMDFIKFRDAAYYVGKYQQFFVYNFFGFPFIFYSSYNVGDVVMARDASGNLHLFICKIANSGSDVPLNSPVDQTTLNPINDGHWLDVTNGTFDNGTLYYDAPHSKAGLFVTQQSVSININPPTSFTGIAAKEEICQDAAQRKLTAVIPTANAVNVGTFLVSYDSINWVNGTGEAVSLTTAGVATFDVVTAWSKVDLLTNSVAYFYNAATSYLPGANVVYNSIKYTAIDYTTGNTPSSSPAKWAARTLTVSLQLYYDNGSKGSTANTCAGISTIKFHLHQTPTSDFFNIPSQTFCTSDPAFSFYAAPSPGYTAQSIPSYGLTLSGFGVKDTGSGTATFDPMLEYTVNSVAGTSTVVVTSNLIDKFGCTGISTNNTMKVNSPPLASYYKNTDSAHPFTPGANPDISLCYNDAPTFTKQQANSYFLIQYRDNDVDTLLKAAPASSFFTLNAKTYFDQSVAAHGSDPASNVPLKLHYYSFDANSCVTSIVNVNVSIAPTVPVDIGGINNGDVFCSNNPGTTSILLQMTPYISGSQIIFQINGVDAQPSIQGGNAYYLYTVNSRLGPVVFKYNVQTGDALCQNPITKTIHVLASPKASFLAPPHCDGDIIQFQGNDVSTEKASIAPGVTTSYSWIFADSRTQYSSSQDTSYQWNVVGGYNVKLRVDYSADPTYNKACYDTTSRSQRIGAIPVVDFSYANVCSGDITNFVATGQNGVTQFKWDFGGVLVPYGANLSTITGQPGTAGTYQNPTHAFVPTSYPVTVTGQTSPSEGSCIASKTRKVSILRVVKISPDNAYAMTAANQADWVVEDNTDSLLTNWSWGDISPDSSNTMTEAAWMNAPYKATDASYVNSPCFNMEEFYRPALGLHYFSDVRKQLDGAVVQYSTSVTGGIQSWKTLGSIGSGLNWYGTQGISAKPGVPINNPEFNPNSFGWSTEADTAWSDAKHSLDDIITPDTTQRKRVRFRIAFGADKGATLNHKGFAFNNVTIVERNRISLIESFTNSTITTAAATTHTNNFDTFNPGGNSQVVRLEYHTALPKPDKINLQNPVDPDARAGFYGITNTGSLIPRGYLDGVSQGNFSTGWLPNAYKLQSLSASPMVISIDMHHDTVRVVTTPTNTITTGNLRLLVVAIEHISSTEDYVVRKIYPSPGGEIVPVTQLDKTHPFTKEYKWNLFVPDADTTTIVPANISIVAFIQDIDTRAVLQAAYMAHPNAINVITGLDVPGRVAVYPNPSSRDLHIEISEAAKKNVPVRLMNMLGEAVIKDEFAIGESKKVLNISSLPEGVYVLQLGSKKGVFKNKIIVVH